MGLGELGGQVVTCVVQGKVSISLSRLPPLLSLCLSVCLSLSLCLSRSRSLARALAHFLSLSGAGQRSETR